MLATKHFAIFFFKKIIQYINYCSKHLKVFQEAKSVLLWCATPESLVRLENSNLPNEETEHLRRWYYEHQAHDSLIQYLNEKIIKQKYKQLFAQVCMKLYLEYSNKNYKFLILQFLA